MKLSRRNLLGAMVAAFAVPLVGKAEQVSASAKVDLIFDSATEISAITGPSYEDLYLPSNVYIACVDGGGYFDAGTVVLKSQARE